jgi:hypothetical protein
MTDPSALTAGVKAVQQSTEAATMIASHLVEANRPLDLTIRVAEAMIAVRDAGTKNER